MISLKVPQPVLTTCSPVSFAVDRSTSPVPAFIPVFPHLYFQYRARIVNGAGQFEVELSAAETDACLEKFTGIEAVAEVRTGTPQRRGRSTPSDPVAARLAAGLEQALDPEGMLQ